MPPKTEKRKTSQEEKPTPLKEEINTAEWRCAVLFAVESAATDVMLTSLWVEEASLELRKEVKSIDFTAHIMKLLSQFAEGEISNRFSFLMNFSSVFEEAAKYARSSERLPASLSAQVIKAFIMLLKKEDLERRGEQATCENDPIEIMASKPFGPSGEPGGKDKAGRRESLAGNDKKKQGKRASVGKTGNEGSTVKVRPPTTGKKDTKLLRRGEQMKAGDVIDDLPENSYYHLYIAVTGFRDPELPLEMVKAGIPLHCVLCLNAGEAVERCSLASRTLEMELERYWNEFPKLLWNSDLTPYFRDVVFLVYTPKTIPTCSKDLRSFIYKEISFLLYDLSDLTRQLKNYHRRMRVCSVEEGLEKVKVNERFAHELDRLPHDCINIPLIAQYLLDTLCEEEDSGEPPNETLSMYTDSTFGDIPRSPTSFTSLLPFKSIAILSSRNWSTVIDTDEKNALYMKMLTLDREYGVDVNKIGDTASEDMSYNDVCKVSRKRLPCENLDAEVRNYSQGLLAKYWMNYPRSMDEAQPSNNLTLAYPQYMANYVLYVLWVSRIDSATPENERNCYPEDITFDSSRTKFTVTDGSRIALHKVTQAKDFFSPSQLKIIPPETLKSFSAPQLRPATKFSWTDRSFVSDAHIPAKYLQGTPMTVFDDLRKHFGEDAFSKMKDYDFIEELNQVSLIQRIEDLSASYDSIRHAYSPLTDSIYVVMENEPSASGVLREVYNVMLRTPVGLRDFHEYILDDEREWIGKQRLGMEGSTRMPDCPVTMYNPTSDFRDFTDYDFWIEDSIKYSCHADSVLNAAIDSVHQDEATEKKAEQAREPAETSTYAQSGEPYHFFAFDFEPGAIQFSGMETRYKGPNYCSVRVSLQERLYGEQQLGLHVQQGGHHLHLYSFVCPVPHIEQPYTFHVEYKNGIIAAFSRRVSIDDAKDTSSQDTEASGKQSEVSDKDQFAYDMKLTVPNGLSVRTVREHTYPCYIKQAYEYQFKDSPPIAKCEKSRLFLPNGSIVKMMTDNTVQVLKMDTSVVTAPLQGLTCRTSQTNSVCSVVDEGSPPRCFFRSYTETMTNGCQYTVLDGEVQATKRFQVIQNVDMETQTTYFKRMDSTNYMTTGDGTVCVEFPDGSKISTTLREEEVCTESDYLSYGEEANDEVYVVVHQEIVMEHPNYATVIYDSRTSSWRVLLPQESTIDIDPQGWYHVNIDRQTELDVSGTAIRMWRYSPRDEFITSTVADLTVFGKELPLEYCVTTDTTGRRFVVEADGNCRVVEESESNEQSAASGNDAEVMSEPKKYFVVRRDFTGFEIIHTKYVKKEVEEAQPEVVTYCQELDTVPRSRYFAFVKASSPKEQSNKWRWEVRSITPDVKFRKVATRTSTAYGVPPSWMHPFPKRKTAAPIPEALEGRILLETKPTDCPCPTFNSKEFAFYDVTQIPEPKTSLKDDLPALMRRVANQDQDMLREVYYAAIRQRVVSNRLSRPCGPELEQYLKMSKYHVENREHLKHAIAHKVILGYFDQPLGVAWLILQGIIESKVQRDIKRTKTPEPPPVTSRTQSSTESSEMEYNLQWPSEPSYSDLTFRSNLSMKTAPPAIGKTPPFPDVMNTPRGVKSEPIYKMEDITTDDNLSYAPGYSFTPPPSQVCVFTKEDLLALERTSAPKEKEPERPAYELEDLMNLGLV